LAPNKEIHMKSYKQLALNLIADESGQDLIEYALVAALVGLGAVASMKTLSTSIGTAFTSIGTTLTTSV
jgi:pilus assembly protein Flp/PilA